MTDGPMFKFRYFYVETLRRLVGVYEDTEFLYPHRPPWPQETFDYPYGMAPAIDEVPADETRDWEQWVGGYYRDIALSLDTHTNTNDVSDYLARNITENGVRGYAGLTDSLFCNLIGEGLYSKFISLLDPADIQLFFNQSEPPNDGFQYLKADFSCMRVIDNPWTNQFVAPTIVLLRRQPLPGGSYSRCVPVMIAIAKQGKSPYGKDDVRVLSPVPENKSDPTDPAHNAWRLAKYFALQGAIHRTTMVEHVKVHFPHDVINAVTKAVLPEWHVLQQLLLPHFWLTLPVNYAVLEGPRSLINRDTWYPWSPLAATGDEARKLLSFAWAGYPYWFPAEKNQSYPPFVFTHDPRRVPDPWQPGQFIETFIGLEASQYAKFLFSYWEPILEFARAFVSTALNPVPTNPEMHADLEWLEIQHWADEISKYLPGFPDWRKICSVDTLAETIAIIIWNASVVHSADHATLHKMLEDCGTPVPFIMRVAPDQTVDTIGDAIGETGRKALKGLLEAALGVEKGAALAKAIDTTDIPTDKWWPLCWPTDITYAQMADILFFKPHNTTTLHDTEYPFTHEAEVQKMRDKWPGRPVPDHTKVKALKAAHDSYHRRLVKVNDFYYPPGLPVPPIVGTAAAYGFPRLVPPADAKDPAESKRTGCIGAGIQY